MELANRVEARFTTVEADILLLNGEVNEHNNIFDKLRLAWKALTGRISILERKASP
jgi:hypothetical protein